MDRRQAKAFADAAGSDSIGAAVLAMVMEERVADLYINNKGLYGAATKVNQTIDHPGEDTDPVLASVELSSTGRWPHITNIGDASDAIASFNNVDPTTASQSIPLVDTDGDGTPDAILWETSISSNWKKYWAAVRVIDASARMNVNTAQYEWPAVAGMTMPYTNIVTGMLLNGTVRNAIHNARTNTTGESTLAYNANYVIRPLNPAVSTYLPFDMTDMFSLLWQGGTASGRLYDTINDATLYGNKRTYMTTMSASRVYIPIPVTDTGTADHDQTYKADLNKDDFETLFKAFYNAIPAGNADISANDTAHRKTAAQLAVNTIDFRDTDSDITVEEVPPTGSGVYVYGIERQPFVTELFFKKYKDGGGTVTQYSAIELFNPYKTPIDLAGFDVMVGASSVAPTGGWSGKTIPAEGYVVLVSNAGDLVAFTGVTEIEIPNMALSSGVRIFRSRNDNGTGAKDVMIVNTSATVTDPPVNNSGKHKVCVWHSGLAEARYARDLKVETLDNNTYDYTSASGYGTMGAGSSYLGRANVAPTLPAAIAPCAVYVRNGDFINFGDMSRIFYVGPSNTQSLQSKLGTTDSLVVGRLVPWADPSATGSDTVPAIPVGAILANYLMVASPMADGIDNDGNGTNDNDGENTVYGLININTAPTTVLETLPGFIELSSTSRTAIVSGITTYRSGTPFRSPAEIAIPVYNAGKILAAPTEKLPLNTYASNAAPQNYAVGRNGFDDGLNFTTARVDGDMVKNNVYYSWLSNQVTVRSDVYIVYIRVQPSDVYNETEGVLNYVAVIDRSNCRVITDRPNVQLFMQVE